MRQPCRRRAGQEGRGTLFPLEARLALFEHGVERLPVVVGEVAQGLVGRGLEHALHERGVDPVAEQFPGQAGGLAAPGPGISG